MATAQRAARSNVRAGGSSRASVTTNRSTHSSQGRRTSNATHNRRNNIRPDAREQYIYDNTARALRPIDEEIRSPKKLSNKSRKSAKHVTSMNPGFVLFLMLAMTLTGFVCIRYIQLQSSVTAYVDKISAMEIRLEELRAENDDYESRIKGAVGLENIKKRAMDELGMSYASDEQIVIYESDGTDYVRQYVSLE